MYCFFKIWNRFTVIGSEKLPSARQGFILAANHVSYLDPPVLGAGVKRHISFLAKEQLFKFSFLGPVITLLGALPIAGESDFRAIRAIIRRLKSGDIVSIFPEGTRSPTGEISQDTKSGVAFLAHAAKVPVVPCFIDGTELALPRGIRIIRPRRIKVYIDEPYQVPESDSDRNEHYEKSTQYVMQRIQFLKELADQSKKRKK